MLLKWSNVCSDFSMCLTYSKLGYNIYTKLNNSYLDERESTKARLYSFTCYEERVLRKNCLVLLMLLDQNSKKCSLILKPA